MIVSLFASVLLWSGVTVKQVSDNFSNPPQELASHVIWGWEGPMDIETIRHDLDSIKTKGFRSVIFEAGYHLPFEYLSDDWFKAIRTGVLEAKARGLKVWIIDEGKYPSGFAGGKFTKERPEMRMKAIVSTGYVHVDGGAVITDAPAPQRSLSAVAVSQSGQSRVVPLEDGKYSFSAGAESWDITFAGWDYRTGQTRAVNNPTGGKDTSNSQSDYLSREAIRQFIDWTHEQYKKYIGEEFGKTVLGFRGDEPDFGYIPWTEKLKETFVSLKGYDPEPMYASLLLRSRDEEQRRFRADYYDVWSGMFADSFFKQQADWCAENGLQYVTHLNKDHDMYECVRVEGSLFRDLSKVQVPGVDAIWNQIWPQTPNDFPKYASSVSHVYGKQRAFSESFAAYNTPPTIPTAKYAVDYQMARGINFFEFMFWMAGSKNANWMTDEGLKPLNDYTNRITYLLTQGTPGARIAVYCPTSSFWLEDRQIAKDLTYISQTLLHHQRDFDWVDDDAFLEALEVSSGCFETPGGQKYSTLVIPSADVISAKAWERIEAFSAAGGKVLFWGRKPGALIGRTFSDRTPLPSLAGAVEESSIAWTPAVESAMPEPELSLGLGEEAMVTYAHRHLADGDVYFIFNEGETECSFELTLDSKGKVYEWNGYDGTKSRVKSRKSKNGTSLSLTLAPWESVTLSVEN